MTQKILLIQARNVGDPMLEHELECFAARCEVDREAFTCLNLCCDVADPSVLDEVARVMVGGSGEYSLASGGFHWHEDYLELLRQLVERDIPTFASCFGFQGLVQALGGTVETDPDSAEVGTFRVQLTEHGANDEVFKKLPGEFDVQLGHNDSVRNLPSTIVRLAFSERCETQAIRVRGTRIVATQFHPELTVADNITRYERYLEMYNAAVPPELALKGSAAMHRPSHEANTLLKLFLAS